MQGKWETVSGDNVSRGLQVNKDTWLQILNVQCRTRALEYNNFNAGLITSFIYIKDDCLNSSFYLLFLIFLIIPTDYNNTLDT